MVVFCEVIMSPMFPLMSFTIVCRCFSLSLTLCFFLLDLAMYKLSSSESLRTTIDLDDRFLTFL